MAEISERPSASGYFRAEQADILVLELSSFQLDTASTFRPDTGVLLNVTEDHLDRYKSFKAYEDSKLSLFRRQNRADFAIINGDDPICRERIKEIPGHGPDPLAARTRPQTRGSRAAQSRLAVPGKGKFEIGLEKTTLQGTHNRENIMAAALAAFCMGVARRSNPGGR